MKNKIYLAIILSITVISAIFVSIPVDTTRAATAGDAYTLLAPLPCIEANDVVCPKGNMAIEKQVSFEQYVQYMINVVIGLCAVLAVLMIVWGGFTYMTTESFNGKSDAKEKITNAIYGLILVLCSYLILKTIDPRLVDIPTTLVPQLTIKYEYSNMLLQAEKDIAKYAANADNLAAELRAYRDKENELKPKLADLNAQLATAIASANQTEIDKLTRERDAVQNQLTVNESEQIVASAKLEFNSYIRTIVIAFPAETGTRNAFNTQTYTDNELIRQIDSAADTLKSRRDFYSSRLIQLGHYDLTAFNNHANYTESVISLYKAQVLSKNRTGASAALTIVSSAKQTANSITDPSLKTDLQKRITEVEMGFPKTN